MGWLGENGVARKEETRKAKKEVYGCGERGYMAEVEVTEDTVRTVLEMEYPLWRPLMGKAERRSVSAHKTNVNVILSGLGIWKFL